MLEEADDFEKKMAKLQQELKALEVEHTELDQAQANLSQKKQCYELYLEDKEKTANKKRQEEQRKKELD